MKTSASNSILAGISVALAGTLSGCANEPSLLEQNFGESVRQMRTAQVAFPEEDANPSGEMPRVTDGQYGQAVVDTYRAGVSQGGTVGEDIELKVGE